MTLFRDFTEDFVGYCPDTMPQANYLGRSVREPIKRGKALLESWFSRYPSIEKDRLRTEFLSPLPSQHRSAYFELFLHEFLLRDGWTLSIHPNIKGTARTPDFLCKRNDISIYVEAKICTGRSAIEQAAITRLETALDTINRRVKSRRFYLDVDTNHLPTNNINGQAIARHLQRWLDSLDYDTCQRNAHTHAFEKYKFHEHGCDMSFTAVPSSEALEDHERVIGMLSHGHEGGFVTPYIDVRDAIDQKANAYGELDRPYIIAINSHDTFFNLPDDGLTALYGQENLQRASSGENIAVISPVRARDGAFGSPDHPRKQNVSGVLLFNNVGPLALSNRSVFMGQIFLPLGP